MRAVRKFEISDFPTKLGKAERAKVGRCCDFQLYIEKYIII